MAHPALTRDEAATRAALLSVDSYDVELVVTGSPDRFRSTSTVRFAAHEAGGSTWIDIVAPELISASLNGAPLDLRGYTGQRLPVTGLAVQNTLVVVARCAYSLTGEGLHRMVDPVDQEVYLYSQFETADAQRVYACFDQPDLKATFTLHVVAPDHWQVVSNAATPTPISLEPGAARWDFPATPRVSTYVCALVAGPYHAVRDEYEGPLGTYPLGVLCRASMAAHLDADRILAETKAGFAFFESAFGHAYPFGKYDQIFVPEFNAGAMENAGCVTIMEDYVFRSRVTEVAYEQRANTILHELAHMWFGDLVTMRWWDDLWLNESFAEWASHYAMVASGIAPQAWTTFSNLRKTWAYRQDQLPSTHPIATAMPDLEAVKLNFDGITYAKGASALRQLVAWVGEEEFLAGLRSYFAAHAWDNTELRDLLVELERTSGRDLTQWTSQWLQTEGVNLLRPQVELAPDGTYASVSVLQEAPASPVGVPAVLRGHRLRVGLFDRVSDRLVRRDQVELDVVGPSTGIPDLIGVRAADLLLVNDDDLTFAKVRLDPRSMATAIGHIGRFEDSLARTLVWGAAWDMTRDAEMSAGEFVELAIGGLPTETDIGAVQKVLQQVRTAIDSYAAPGNRSRYRAAFAGAVHAAALTAAPGSDHQLQYARALAAVAQSDEQLDLLAGLLAGGRGIEGLVVDTELRWTLLHRLVEVGRAGEAQISAELDRDNTATGLRHATAARASRPTEHAKEAAWHAAVADSSLPNALVEANISGLLIAEQVELLRPYRERYFEVAPQVWSTRSSEMAGMVATYLYPALLIEDQTVVASNEFLDRPDLAAGLRRIVTEGRDGVERALRCRARDAAAANS